ncbi:hypothetical protein ES708_05554 [subsurface metagenome]
MPKGKLQKMPRKISLYFTRDELLNTLFSPPYLVSSWRRVSVKIQIYMLGLAEASLSSLQGTLNATEDKIRKGS